jgi:hypothetical protein
MNRLPPGNGEGHIPMRLASKSVFCYDRRNFARHEQEPNVTA